MQINKLEKSMIGTVVSVSKPNHSYLVVDSEGNDFSGFMYPTAKKKAVDKGHALMVAETNTGKLYWKSVPSDMFVVEPDEPVIVSDEHQNTLDFIHNSYKLKPEGLFMNELKWKYLIRSAVRGKNIMMTGMAGSGKTMAAKSLMSALDDRPSYFFNLGATQDPRATLIGNTHFSPESGTYFDESSFVKAIRTSNAIILLDELTRAHPDAWNILMTVLDYGQRYLRLDEKKDSETVMVADGVTFVATANIGNEYTATRSLDRAMRDRFTIIEMDLLTDTEEHGLLKYMFPNVASKALENVSKIAHLTRVESNSENPRIESGISTRTSVELAGLLYDGFALVDAAEITIYPQYDNSGGVDSERTFVKQIIQKFINDESSDELFTENDMNTASNPF